MDNLDAEWQRKDATLSDKTARKVVGAPARHADALGPCRVHLHARQEAEDSRRFGRNGTGCGEHRHPDRACQHALLLVDLSEDVAAEELKALVEDLRASGELSPAEREGLLG